MTKDEENRLWNILYGNTGYTKSAIAEKEKAREALLNWYKSEEYINSNRG